MVSPWLRENPCSRYERGHACSRGASPLAMSTGQQVHLDALLLGGDTACYIYSRKRSSQVGRRQKKRPPRWTALRFPVVFRSSSTLVVHSTRIHLGLAANKPLAIRNKNMVAKRTFKSANKGKAIRLCRNSHYGTSVRRGFRFELPDSSRIEYTRD